MQKPTFLDIQDLDNEQQLQQNNIYQYLPQARPLQLKTIAQPITLFPFMNGITDQIQFSHKYTHNDGNNQQQAQPMEQVQEDRNIGTHQIGNSLYKLFNNPIYKSYQQVQISQDNNKFASCAVKYQEKYQLKPFLIENTQQQLIFQSRFESGNLAIVSKSQQYNNQYYLALQRDTNSKATCQWYYFYVQNKSNIGIYTFNIVNMIKNYSAYQNGMKPCVLSVRNEKGWKRDGFNIMYKKNSINYRGDKNYYTFQFSYNFTHINDRVYFAYSYPYTFTRLQNFLLQTELNYPKLVQVKTLATTPLNNPINIVSITNPSHHHQNDQNQKQQSQKQSKIEKFHRIHKKDLLFITARVHPGQTNSSFACESLIQYFVSDHPQANSLRTYYIIKIIPFLNPDGVIHGNYRCSITGFDLNRKWKKPDKDIHPQIFGVKKYLSQTHYNKMLYIDLHGHSKKKSSFMYGCLNKQNPYLCKQFPFILSKYGHQFCYFNCNFSTPISREGTSRINVWKQFGIDYSYTMEISFCGPIKSRNHFTFKDYFKMGYKLGKVLSVYFCGKKVKKSEINQQQNNHHQHEIYKTLKQFYSQKTLLNQGIQESDGSESGEQQIVTALGDKAFQKQNFTNNKQSKQLKGILTKYLNQTKVKWTKKQKDRSLSKKQQQINQQGAGNLRLRKQLAPSRISIQKIDLSQQINHSYMHFGIFRGKTNIRLISKQLKSNNLKQTTKINNSKNSYRPYSYSKGKMSHKIHDEGSLILPKVLREEQIKYRKYRNHEQRFDVGLCHRSESQRQSRQSNYSSRQISLGEKLFQTTQKQLQENSRYWMRNF